MSVKIAGFLTGILVQRIPEWFSQPVQDSSIEDYSSWAWLSTARSYGLLGF